MSYDLEVRSDDGYSRSEPLERVVSLLEGLGARATGSPPTFMLYDDPGKGQRIEIDLGHEGADDPAKVNFVGFGVPYTFLSASGRTALELASAVASHLGWRMYDPQAGRYFDVSDEAAVMASQASALAAADHVTALGVPTRRSFIGRVLERLVRQTKFMIVVAVVAFGTIGAYAGWISKGGQSQDPRGFVGWVLALALAAVVLRPLILEIAQPMDS